MSTIMRTTHRTTGRTCAVLMAAVVGTAGLQRATAQDAENLTVEVGDCAELASPEARLACFDAQVEAARGARPGSDERRGPAAPSASAPPSEVRSEPVRTTASEFGMNESREMRERRERREGAPLTQELVARVTELRETVPNAYLITLDNGQVWRQTRPLAYPLREGHEVRVYTTGRFGYRMTNRDLRGFIAVERVR